MLIAVRRMKCEKFMTCHRTNPQDPIRLWILISSGLREDLGVMLSLRGLLFVHLSVCVHSLTSNISNIKPRTDTTGKIMDMHGENNNSYKNMTELWCCYCCSNYKARILLKTAACWIISDGNVHVGADGTYFWYAAGYGGCQERPGYPIFILASVFMSLYIVLIDLSNPKHSF